MFIPGDFGRPPPSLQMTKNITTTFLGSSLFPITTVDSNSIFKVKQEEFQFETADGIYTPDIALKIPRTPLLITDPSTYISVSPFTENNIRRYHSAIGNLNHDNVKNPLSLEEIKSQYKPDQLPLGSGVNPLAADYFKPVHLTPGCLAEIVSYDETSSSSSGSNFNLIARSNTITQRNTKMKLWGGSKKNEELALHVATHSDLKLPKSSLSRSSSTFITKVSTTDGLSKKLNSVNELMVTSHGRFLNVINLSDDYTKIEIDIPYVRVLFTVGVITALSTFTSSSKGQLLQQHEKSLDIVIGFSSGDLVWINPFKMKYSRFNKNAKLCNKPVISLAWSPCGRYIYTGFSNGEVMVFNREFDDDENYDATHNVRTEQYAKKFRTLEDKLDSNPVVHFQVSNKPITGIKFNPIIDNLCCIISDDGFLKLIDISKLTITDIYPSYYGGLLCAEFSNDGKYLFIGGEDDFISVYEMTILQPSSSGTLKLISRLEGQASWVRAIKIDYLKSETNLIYRVSSVGDDGNLMFWEFQPRNLPKMKIPLHHRTKSSNSPNLKTLNSGIFLPQQRASSSHRRMISNLTTSSPRRKHSNSVSSLTSSVAQQQQQPHLSIAQTMSSQSQLSLSGMNSNHEMKGSITNMRRSMSKDHQQSLLLLKWTPLMDKTILHPFIGLNGVPILQLISSHDFGLGRLSGVWFDKRYVWVFTCGGDLIRWTRPQKEKNVYIKDFI